MGKDARPPTTVIFAEALWKPVTPPRSLTMWEYAALSRLLSKVPLTDSAAKNQLEIVRVSAECASDLSIAFTNYQEPVYVPTTTTHGHYGSGSMAAELSGKDHDGMEMWILLFARGDTPIELDIQRADGSPFAALPDLDALKLF